MHDEHRSRSPDRGRATVRGRYEHRSFDGRLDGYHRSRQDYSRSPAREDYQSGARYRSTRDQDGMDYDHRYGGPDGDYSGRGRGASRHTRRNDHDYRGMYDEQPDYDGRRRTRRDEIYGRDDRLFRDESSMASPSPPDHRYDQSRSRSPTRDAGRPTDTIILEGLPFSISTSELRESLVEYSIAAEFPSIDVRIQASRGSRRAFVQFENTGNAMAFVQEHFPKVLIQMQHSTDEVPEGKFDAYLHYARNRDDHGSRGPGAANWTCAVCEFSNYSSRSVCKECGEAEPAANWQQSLTGALDAAEIPSQILVVYPLAGFINEDMLATEMKRLELEKPALPKESSDGAPKLKSTAPTSDASGYGARPGSLHRVFLMRDSRSDESFKYGFAEFWTLEDATAAVTKFRMSRNFTVSGCSVVVSTIHMGVFVPEERDVTPATEHMSFCPLFNPAIRVRYRDHHVFPSIAVVASEPPVDTVPKNTENDTVETKKSKKRKAEPGSDDPATKKSAPMAGQMAMWQRKHDELHSNGSGQGSRNGSNGSSTDSKGPIKISLSNSIRLGGGSAVPNSKSPSPLNESRPTKIKVEEVVPTPAQEEIASAVSYVDRDRLMCLICMRKYKSVDEVDIHEKSRNHKNATENEELVKAALPRLEIRDKRLQKLGLTDGDAAGSQYRDRAKERREAHNQPKKPSGAPSKPEGGKVAKDGQPAPPAKPAPSKGAGMLAKMGWTTGAGLGANADGRTETIATNAYQEGVGLGAEGGNLGDAAEVAEKRTKNSYTEYVSTVQDKARERYNNMN